MTIVSRDEIWFVTRMRQHGVEIARSANQAIDGLTAITERRERVRAAILANGIACVLVGNGSTDTYAQAFERLFGEPLIPGAKPKRRTA